jgi:hypothetical protein
MKPMNEGADDQKRERSLSELLEEFAALPAAERQRLIKEADRVLRARGGRL